MLEKCTNQMCSAVSRHLSDGMLFRVPRAWTKSNTSGAAKKKFIKHFWLCAKCTETMTLGISPHRKVTVIPLISARDAAA